MCDCSSPFYIEIKNEVLVEKVHVQNPKVLKIIKIPPKPTVQSKPILKYIPCNPNSSESWKSWRAKLQWRKDHKNRGFKLDVVNGFYGDQKYHDTVYNK